MEITIPNSKTPRNGDRIPFAEFVLVLKRDGDNVVLEAKTPRCFRDFHNFTGAEKDAFNAVTSFVIERAAEAMRGVESLRRDAERRAKA